MEKTREGRIAAVTVTYNRTVTLKKCLDALLHQTRPVDWILVVDNHSREEEQEKLEQLAAQDARIQIIRLPDNQGGAGGFEAGMRKAREQYDPDWYWVMDDDAYPKPDCLEQPLRAGQSMEERQLGFLAPVIWGVDLGEYQLYHHKYIRGLTCKNIPLVQRLEELPETAKVDANGFVGPLISKKAVDLAGVADGSLFIYGDDVEYTYRVTRKLNGYVVKSAVIEHQDPPLTGNYLNPRAWWKEYYSNRNQYFMIRKYARNSLERLLGCAALTLPIIKLMGAALVKPKYRGNRRLRTALLFKAVRDGITDRRGKTLDPGAYNRMLDERNIG